MKTQPVALSHRLGARISAEVPRAGERGTEASPRLSAASRNLDAGAAR